MRRRSLRYKLSEVSYTSYFIVKNLYLFEVKVSFATSLAQLISYQLIHVILITKTTLFNSGFISGS